MEKNKTYILQRIIYYNLKLVRIEDIFYKGNITNARGGRRTAPVCYVCVNKCAWTREGNTIIRSWKFP